MKQWLLFAMEIFCRFDAWWFLMDHPRRRFLGSILHPPSWLLWSCPWLIVYALLYTKQEKIHNEGQEIQLSSNKWCYIVSSLTHPSARPVPSRNYLSGVSNFLLLCRIWNWKSIDQFLWPGSLWVLTKAHLWIQ